MITITLSFILMLPLQAAEGAFQSAQRSGPSLPELFSMGGPFWMSLLTILLVAMLFAAWKAPNWLREIGSAALVVGPLSTLFGLYNVFDTLQHAPAISPLLVYAGAKCAVVPIIYGILIYLVSLVIRIIRKPRI